MRTQVQNVASEETGDTSYQWARVDSKEFHELVKREMDTRNAKHVLLYVHGFRTKPEDVFKDVNRINKRLEKSHAYMIPVIWPSMQELNLRSYEAQKYTAKILSNGMLKLDLRPF